MKAYVRTTGPNLLELTVANKGIFDDVKILEYDSEAPTHDTVVVLNSAITAQFPTADIRRHSKKLPSCFLRKVDLGDGRLKYAVTLAGLLMLLAAMRTDKARDMFVVLAGALLNGGEKELLSRVIHTEPPLDDEEVYLFANEVFGDA